MALFSSSRRRGRGRGACLAPVCALTHPAASGVVASGERGHKLQEVALRGNKTPVVGISF